MATSQRPFKKVKKLDLLTASLNVRITDDQALKLEREGQKRGCSYAQVIRDLVDNL